MVMSGTMSIPEEKRDLCLSTLGNGGHKSIQEVD